MDTPFLFSAMPADNDPDPLFGREMEIDFIKQAILKHQNISIIGDTRIGKTSILRTLQQEFINRNEFKNIIPIYIDFKKLTYDFSSGNDLKVDNFYENILNEVYQYNIEISDVFKNFKHGRNHEFRSVVEYCTRKKIVIVLMLDKFDLITVLRNLDSDFFTYLRGNAYEKGLSIITASRSNLETLCHKGHVAGSHFWNIFSPVITLSIFKDKIFAEQLLLQGISNEKIINILLSNVGNHPCFLKVAANVVIQNTNTVENDESIIVDAIYERLVPYYEKGFNLLKDDEKNVDNGIQYKLEYLSTLFSICKNETIQTQERKKELDNLEQLGYLINDDGRLKIYSPLFARYLNDQNKFKSEVYMGDLPYIFISYSHADKNEIIEEIKNLCSNKYRVWFDEGIEGKWRKSLADKIKNSNTFLVYISPNAVLSDYVIKEIEFAVKHNKQILPVYLKETVLPDELEFEIDEIQAIRKYENYDKYAKKLFSRIDEICKE
jgi:hypothetical protein